MWLYDGLESGAERACATTSMTELPRFGIDASRSGRNLSDEIRWEYGYGEGRQRCIWQTCEEGGFGNKWGVVGKGRSETGSLLSKGP